MQHAQRLPALKQVRAAIQPAGGAGLLQKLAARPVFPASPGLAAAVEQATASISSLPALNTLQAGLESRNAFSPGVIGSITGSSRQNGAPALGAGRVGWQEKQRVAAMAHADNAYAHIQVGWQTTVFLKQKVWSRHINFRGDHSAQHQGWLYAACALF